MEILQKNIDSGGSVRNELSHLKSVLFEFKLSKNSKSFVDEKWIRPILNIEESTFGNSKLNWLVLRATPLHHKYK